MKQQPSIPMKVLVVEDERDLRRMLAVMVATQGFEVVEAADGREALNLAERDRFPIIITDWLMPRLDGMELIRAIRARESGEYSYIIMLTGADDADAFSRGMAAGADDLLTKPWHSEELVARLTVAARIMRLGHELAEANRTLRRANRKLEFFRERVMRELAGAARVQESLLPGEATNFNGVKVSWSLVPCEELAGDVLNVFPLDDDHIALYVLDVSGHGVSAALLSAQLSRLLNPEITQSQLLKRPKDQEPWYEFSPPSVVMRELNGLFPMDPTEPQFFTLLYGYLNLKTGLFSYCSAGHPGPIHQNGGGRARVITVSGTPIGMVRRGSWNDQSLNLCSGDRLVLLSDGLLEAVNAEGEMFGDSRLLEIINESAQLPLGTCCGTVMENLEAWCGTRRLQDDCSLLMIELE